MSDSEHQEDRKQSDKLSDEAKRQRQELLERIGGWLDIPMALLALVWVAVIVVELVVPLPPPWRDWALQLDIIIWLAFLAEFLFELMIAPDKSWYLQTHLLVALSVLLPFFRVFRIVVLLGAIRGYSLVGVLLGVNRASRAATRFLGKSRLLYVIFFDSLVVTVGSALVYFFEREADGANILTFGDAFWWAAALITTINMSLEPVTLEGRIIGFLIRVVALATFGYVTASFATYLIESKFAAERAGEEAQNARAEEEGELAHLASEISSLRETLEKLERQTRL